MGKIVDPSPMIAARLAALAADFGPRIEALQGRVEREARGRARRQVKKELRQLRREYRAARRLVTAADGGISW